MKAKIKATGQIIELCPYVYDIDGNDFLLEEVELLDSPNWQQARINAAIKIEGSILSNYDFFGQAIQIECNNTGKTRTQVIAQIAVELADDLVAELQKKGGNDDSNVH